MLRNRLISQKNTYPEVKMTNKSKGNGQVNNKNTNGKKASARAAVSSAIVFSHRTPTQLHASIYTQNSK